MKRFNIKKYWWVSFFVINCNSIVASNDNLHTNMHINWWNIGPKYQLTPALGWYSITFLIFIFLVIYYGCKILSKLFNDRHRQIKKEIAESQQLKTAASKKLKEYHQKIKNLNKELEIILTKFRIKGENEKASINSSISKFKNQVHNNVNLMINSHIRQVKMTLKQELIDDIILEVLKKLQSDIPHSINKKYEEKIIKDISDLKINL